MKANKLIKAAIAVFLVLILIAFGAFVKTGIDLSSLRMTEVELEEVADGVYRGETNTLLVKAEVEVEVRDHKITRIDILRHITLLGRPAEAITSDMVTENTYEVDAVSGATTSSEVIKYAVNQALLEGLES